MSIWIWILLYLSIGGVFHSSLSPAFNKQVKLNGSAEISPAFYRGAFAAACFIAWPVVLLSIIIITIKSVVRPKHD